MAIDYVRFSRLVARCQEIVAAPGAARVLDVIYRTTTAAPLRRYVDAAAAVDAAMDRWRKALADRTRALGAMDGPFRTGRAAVKAIYPETVLPGTLKVQSTDTDKRQAIERFLTIVSAYRGQDWADAILDGDIGRQAAVTVRAINAASEAADALERAQGERARVFTDARIAFYAFKKLVRRELGATSNEYRRLQVRTVARCEGGGTESVEEAGTHEMPEPNEAAAPGVRPLTSSAAPQAPSPPRPAFDYNLPRAAADPRRPLPPRRPHRPRRARRGLGGP